MPGRDHWSIGLDLANGQFYFSGDKVEVTKRATFAVGDRVGLFVDRPNVAGYFTKNGEDIDSYIGTCSKMKDLNLDLHLR